MFEGLQIPLPPGKLPHCGSNRNSNSVRTDTTFCHSLRAGQETVTDFTARRTIKLHNNGARLADQLQHGPLQSRGLPRDPWASAPPETAQPKQPAARADQGRGKHTGLASGCPLPAGARTAHSHGTVPSPLGDTSESGRLMGSVAGGTVSPQISYDGLLTPRIQNGTVFGERI